MRVIKVSVFQAKGSRDCTGGVTYSPRAEGSSVVRGSFFAEFILFQYNSGIDARMIYFRETSIVLLV